MDNIRKIIAFFSLGFIVSCCCLQIKHTDIDGSLLFQQDEKGRIWLSSLNSAQQIKITEFKYEGDTLIINYKRGVFCKSNNILPLKDNTKFLKCANKFYKVEKVKNEFQVIEINK